MLLSCSKHHSLSGAVPVPCSSFRSALHGLCRSPAAACPRAHPRHSCKLQVFMTRCLSCPFHFPPFSLFQGKNVFVSLAYSDRHPDTSWEGTFPAYYPSRNSNVTRWEFATFIVSRTDLNMQYPLFEIGVEARQNHPPSQRLSMYAPPPVVSHARVQYMLHSLVVCTACDPCRKAPPVRHA